MHEYIEFNQAVGEEDFGFILDKTGRLKGIWMPKGMTEKDIPDPVVDVIHNLFDVDITDDQNYGTIH